MPEGEQTHKKSSRRLGPIGEHKVPREQDVNHDGS